jgi:DNA-binding GntR family transcriptional regulator
MQRIRKESFADMAYRAIRDSIVMGRFEQGERLVEVRLADDLGVSKAPIREALKRLADERLVLEKPRSGTFVRTLVQENFVHIYNMRLAIEGLAARLLVRAGSPLDALEALVEEMGRAAVSGYVDGVADADVAFHEELCATTGNEYLETTFRTLSGPIRMALALDNEAYGRLADIVSEHAALLDALRSGAEDRAFAAVQSHVLDAARKRRIGIDQLVTFTAPAHE